MTITLQYDAKFTEIRQTKKLSALEPHPRV